MRFSPEELAQAAPDLLYVSNQLHGDEIQAESGATFEPDEPDEWLGRDEIGEFIRRFPATELLLVDDSAEERPQVYRVNGDAMTSWTQRLSRLYISDEGIPDPDLGWSLEAHRWTTSNGRELLVFRVSC
jgi:hypothetical protein